MIVGEEEGPSSCAGHLLQCPAQLLSQPIKSSGKVLVFFLRQMKSHMNQKSCHLELQQEKKYMMAVIVGTIGGVAVIAFIIAAVRYVGHNNKKSPIVSPRP